MADVADPIDQQSPSAGDEGLTTGNGNGQGGETRGIKRPRVSAAAGDDDDDDDDKPGRERRKIDIKFIQDKSRRHITFSKRKAGIMKKVHLFDSSPSPMAAMSSSRRMLMLLARLMSYRFSRGPKFCCWWCPKLAWSTLSQLRSSNP